MNQPEISMNQLSMWVRRLSVLVLPLVLGACGGDGTGWVTCGTCGLPSSYQGTVSGLPAGTSVLLQDDFGNVGSVATNGNFTVNVSYAVPQAPDQLGVLVQPVGALCTVTNGALGSNGVVPVSVVCQAQATPPASGLSLYAGMVQAGSADGTASTASFAYPEAMAVDGSGNVLVADTLNHCIRKVAPGGVVTTLAGTAGVIGGADGTGAAASFYQPEGIAIDASTGLIYVADTGNQTIRVITPAGAVTTLAGGLGLMGSTDSTTGTAARFYAPEGLAFNATTHLLYVADAGNHTVRQVTTAGAVTTLAGTAGVTGVGDGTGAAASFTAPGSMGLDANGNIYVSDGAAAIRKITAAGVVTTLAVPAATFGQSIAIGSALLAPPELSIAVTPAGDVYAAGSNGVTVIKVAASGAISTVLGAGGQFAFNAGPLPGNLSFPQALALQGSTLYISVNSGIAVATQVP
jgi:DNA-binding beta-propeller fold protein YncE